jgi:hypothetical protein
MQITVPVYYTQTFKTKKDKTFLVGMNWYRNAFYHIQNEVKQCYHSIISTSLADQHQQFSQYKVTYIYHYKSKISDLSNVCSMMSKFFNDTLQTLEIVPNDNVQFCKEEHFIAGNFDKSNPRVEIYIEELKVSDE